MSRPPGVPARVRRARLAVAALFLTNGALFANLVPRLPEVKDDLALSNAAYGVVLAAMPAGALVAGLLAGVLVARLRSSRVAVAGTFAVAAGFAVVPHVSAAAPLASLLFVVGGLDAIVDVAQNAHGLRVQRRYGRSIVNGLHGLWSIGAVTGGLLGVGAAGLGVPLSVHLAVSGVLFAAVAFGAYPFLLPGAEHEGEPVTPARGGGRGPRRSRLALAPLGALAVCGALVEDAGSSWGAVYLRGEVGAGPATAGLAFVALQAAMTAGRLTGDRVVDRLGARAVTRGGGVLTAAGMGLTLAVPSVGTTVVGYALAGLGVATLAPGVMHAADELPGLARGAGLTVVSWVLRMGFLVSPPLVGIVADAASLRVALVAVVLAGVGMVVLGGVLPTRSAAGTSRSPLPGTGA